MIMLGRLHAIDRLIDIVCDAAGSQAMTRSAITSLKNKAFLRILDAGSPFANLLKKTIAELRSALNTDR
jgi:uncharacterized protein Yka (UPF0111/DUF47 family)